MPKLEINKVYRATRYSYRYLGFVASNYPRLVFENLNLRIARNVRLDDRWLDVLTDTGMTIEQYREAVRQWDENSSIATPH
jgi:hypothetical protein